MNHKLLLALLLLCLSGCESQTNGQGGAEPETADAGPPPYSYVYMGTGDPGRYSSEDFGTGIYKARLDSVTGELTMLGLEQELRYVPWLLTHPELPQLYAAAGDVDVERDVLGIDSTVVGYAIDADSGALTRNGQSDLNAIGITQLDYDERSGTILGALMTGGMVTVSPVDADGILGEMASSQAHHGDGPHPRQSGPRAHGAVFDPSGRYALSAGFGSDRIFVNEFDPATRQLTPAATPYVEVPPASGPRHLVFHPNGEFLYATMEFSGELASFRWNAEAATLEPIATLDTYPEDYSGDRRSVSDLVFSRDGRFLYVAVRGDQSQIARYSIDPETGDATEVQRIPSDGSAPWTLGVDPTGRWLVVANAFSNSVNVFSIDPESGELGPTGYSVEVPVVASVAVWQPY